MNKPKTGTSNTKPKRRQKLIIHRLEAGLSQEDAAYHFKVHVQTIGRHERGELNLTHDWLERYARLYGCRPADLLDDTEQEQREAEIYGYLKPDFKIERSKKSEKLLISMVIPAAELQVIKVKQDIFPLFRKGDLIAIDVGKEFTPKLCMNRQCIIEVTRMTTLFGVFKRGSVPNRYHITPLIGTPMDDKQVLTAYPIKAVIKS